MTHWSLMCGEVRKTRALGAGARRWEVRTKEGDMQLRPMGRGRQEQREEARRSRGQTGPSCTCAAMPATWPFEPAARRSPDSHARGEAKAQKPLSRN